MQIDTSKLSMTLDAIRQEVIKKEGERMAIKYEQKYMNAGMFLITIPFGMLILSLTINGGKHQHNFIAVPVYTLMCIGCLALGFVVRGRAENEYYRENRTNNFGLSEEEIERKVADYVGDILQKMNTEMEQAEKDIIALQQKYTAMKNAYYEPSRIYSAFNVTKNIK